MKWSIRSLLSFLYQHKKTILLGALLLVLIVGIVYSIMLGNELRFLPDERDYLVLAKNLSRYQMYAFPVEQSPIWEGPTPHDLVYTAYRPPGYPLFLAIFVWMGATVAQLRIVNFLTLTLTLYLVYRVLERWSRREESVAPILGALMVLAYPVLIFTAGTLYPQILGGMLFVLVLYLLSRDEIWSMVAGGVAFGYLCLTIPVFLFTLPLLIGWLLMRKEVPLRHILAFTALALMVLGIWTVRNYRVFGQFVPISTNAGVNLALGNADFTVVNAETDVDFLQKWPRMHELTEIEQNRYLRQEAFQFMRENPGQAAKLYLQKLLNYFNFRNRLATEGLMLSWYDWVMLLSYGAFLVLFFLRLLYLRALPLRKGEGLLLAIYLGSALVNAIFFTRIRLRLPFDYGLILLNALFLERLLFRMPGASSAENEV